MFHLVNFTSKYTLLGQIPLCRLFILHEKAIFTHPPIQKAPKMIIYFFCSFVGGFGFNRDHLFIITLLVYTIRDNGKIPESKTNKKTNIGILITITFFFSQNVQFEPCDKPIEFFLLSVVY